jgi:hypothetical protein
MLVAIFWSFFADRIRPFHKALSFAITHCGVQDPIVFTITRKYGFSEGGSTRYAVYSLLSKHYIHYKLVLILMGR